MQAAGYDARPTVLEREFNLRYAGDPMTLHGVRRWLVGETVPSQGKMDVLADWLGVDATFLATGRRALEVRDSPQPWGSDFSADDKDTVAAFLGLKAQQKRIVREVIRAFAKAGKA